MNPLLAIFIIFVVVLICVVIGFTVHLLGTTINTSVHPAFFSAGWWTWACSNLTYTCIEVRNN